MVTILHRRQHGYDVRIYTRDHLPVHVHVFKGEKRVRVALNPIEISENRGFTSREIRKILVLLDEHEALIRREWEQIYGPSEVKEDDE